MLVTQITIVGGPEHQKKELTEIAKDTLQAVIDYWHTNIAPRHFQRGARGKYNYQPRKDKAYWRRWPEKRGKPDLVFSGRMERMVLQRLALSGTAKLARGRMTGPTYLVEAGSRKYVRVALLKRDRRTGGASGARFIQLPDMGSEVIAVTPDEERELLAFADKYSTVRLNGVATTETRSI